MPGFFLVGLPDAAVREAQERVRVRTAIRNTGLVFPRRRITINLSPADLQKAGPTYDLPIALEILSAACQVPPGPRVPCERLANQVVAAASPA